MRVIVDQETAERRRRATAAFHERAAFHLARVGRTDDAAEALRAVAITSRPSSDESDAMNFRHPSACDL